MSLINQMLRDLENRRSERPSFNLPLTDLQPARLVSLFEKWFDYRVTLFVGCCLLFLVISLFKIFSNRHDSEASTSTYSSSVAAAAPETSLMGIFTSHQANLIQKSSSNVAALNLAKLQDIKVTRHDDTTHVSLSFDKPTLYNLESDDEPNQITLVLDHAGIQKNIVPSDYIDSAIQDITVATNSDGDLSLTFHVPSDAVVKSLNSFDSAQHVITLDIVSASSNTSEQTLAPQSTQNSQEKINAPIIEKSSEAIVGSSKKITTPSESEVTNQKLQSIMELVNRGQVDVAIRLLRNLVAKSPSFLPAQESLAVLLGQSGSVLEATQILDNARRQFGNDSGILKLEAELLSKQGKTQEAITLLSSVNRPNFQHDPEYYALLASLEEKSGKFAEAKQIYEQLVTYKPDNSVWWVGFGIALENLGKHEAALSAYGHAAQNGNLSPELLAYVSEQLGSSTTT